MLVVAETYSWFLHKMGEEAARRFKQLLNQLERLKLFEISEDHHQAAFKMLNRLHGSKLTYVDASSLCLIEHHKIRRVWSTDHHIGLTGVEVVPK